jgi:hypothetical protein
MVVHRPDLESLPEHAKTKNSHISRGSDGRLKAMLPTMAWHVVSPLFCGAAIYTCWRKPTLLVFTWYREIGLDSVVKHVRLLAHPVYPLIPKWILFSLPDGLWVYAWTAFMALVWHRVERSLVRELWICGGVALAAGGEFGQLARIVPGTFDSIDLVVYLAAFVSAPLLVKRALTRRRETLYYAE